MIHQFKRYEIHAYAMSIALSILLLFLINQSTLPRVSADDPVPSSQLTLDLVPSWPIDPLMNQAQEREVWRKLLQRCPSLPPEIPLSELAYRLDSLTPTRLDRRALEGIGLDGNVMVEPFHSQTDFSWMLQLMVVLRDLELTLHLKHNLLYLTTFEDAETDLPIRVYKVTSLVGTGEMSARREGISALMQLIQNQVEPNAWEALGGVGTMSPSLHDRDTLLTVSAMTTMHWQIQTLLNQMVVAGDVGVIATDANETWKGIRGPVVENLPAGLPVTPSVQGNSTLPVFRP